jgi:hypothetical protein
LNPETVGFEHIRAFGRAFFTWAGLVLNQTEGGVKRLDSTIAKIGYVKEND